ncbi:MAG: hypothetical protein GX561_11205 [Lentisphaerae bacterium]|nr:hypothetical protein [Lentisphaerota bacterium]
MRQDQPTSGLRPTFGFPISAWMFLTALLFSIMLSPAIAESSSTTPADIEQLFKAEQFMQALLVLKAWKQAPPDGIDERQRLLLEGRCLLGLGRHSEAIEALGTMLAINPEAKDNATMDAANCLGDALAVLGRLDEAAEQWLKAAEMKPAVVMEELARKKASTYSRNRVEMDVVVSEQLVAHAKMALAQSKAKNPDGIIAANMRQLNLAVDFPGMRETAVQTAELMLAEKLPNKAFTLFLRILDSGLDRCFSGIARLPENQRQLNLVAKPPSADITRRALAGVNQCLASSLAPDEALPPEKLEALTAVWIQAMAATFRPDIGTATPFIALSKSELPASWRSLCCWKAANALLREGAFHEVHKLLNELPDGGLSMASRFALCKGMACIGEGDFSEATIFFRIAAESEDPVLSSQARLAMAEAHEALFEWDSADGEYRALASSSPIHWHRREAAYALRRIAELRQRPPAADRGKVIALLRDDRSTRGRWFLGYGMDFHLLAAQNFITDEKGGAGTAMACRFSTADPKEKSRLWVTRRRETDLVALWNPHEKSHTSANRDDYGEQYPLGTGPDLLMSCEIPAGKHVLALYFANDYNYYESQRAYTVSVTDEDGRLLCLAPIRNFGGGLYKRFAVQGPAQLEFRIWRNMSINVLLSGVFLDEWRMSPPPTSLASAFAMLPVRLQEAHATLLVDAGKASPEAFPCLEAKALLLAEKVRSEAQKANGRELRALSALLEAGCRHAAGNHIPARECFNLAMKQLGGLDDKRRAALLLRKLTRHGMFALDKYQLTYRWVPPGDHPLEMIWQEYFKCWEKTGANENLPKAMVRTAVALVQTADWRVTARARNAAMAFIPEAIQTRIGETLLYARAKQTGREGDYKTADALFAETLDFLARKPNESMRTRVLADRLEWQAYAGAKLEEIAATYRALEPLRPKQPGLDYWSLKVAEAYARENHVEEAKKWLEKAVMLGLPEAAAKTYHQAWQTNIQDNATGGKK